jgi:alkylation response protein AidB-like acyl-CoA dehydrogenase
MVPAEVFAARRRRRCLVVAAHFVAAIRTALARTERSTVMATDVWARRAVFCDDHEAFRESARTFVERHVTPHVQRWEDERLVPRAPWLEAGRQGFLGIAVPEEYGGAGVDDYRFRCAVIEEFARVGAASAGNGFTTHVDIVLPYLVDLATADQAKRWLPDLVSGHRIGAIAMTEPGAGSDLRSMRTSARRDGDEWVLNGTKTFITNGIQADLVVVAARTDPDSGSHGFSLFVVERGASGFERGRKLRKIGLHGQDTAELTFTDVRVPAENLLGDEGKGLIHLMERLPRERLSIAVTGVAGARAALGWTIDYTTNRTAFGRPIADFQNSHFALAEMLTEIEVTQAYVDDAVSRLNRGELSAVDAAKAKWWATEMHKRVVDRCVQLHGGYGYMEEYPIARAYADTRITTIYGGTTEIMKLIIGRDLLGRR